MQSHFQLKLYCGWVGVVATALVCYIYNIVIYHSKMPVEIYNPVQCQPLCVATVCKHQDKEYKVKSFVSYQQL